MKISLMALIAGFCLVVGLPLAATAGPTPGGPSAADGDGIEDYFDNCMSVSNAAQKDSDHDGCGNRCDADFNNNGAVESVDLSAFIASYLKTKGQPGYNDRCDMNSDNAVSSTDLSLFISYYLGAPGPSGFFGTTGPAGTESQRCSYCPGPNGGVGSPAPCP